MRNPLRLALIALLLLTAGVSAQPSDAVLYQRAFEIQDEVRTSITYDAGTGRPVRSPTATLSYGSGSCLEQIFLFCALLFSEFPTEELIIRLYYSPSINHATVLVRGAEYDLTEGLIGRAYTSHQDVYWLHAYYSLVGLVSPYEDALDLPNVDHPRDRVPISSLRRETPAGRPTFAPLYAHDLAFWTTPADPR